MITLMYWCFVIPNSADVFVTTTFEKVKFDMDHTLPFTYTLIDWCLNSIGAQMNQIWPNMAFSLVYGLVNWFFVVVLGQFIYPVLTWDSWQAYLIAAALIPLFLVVQVLLVLCTNYKLSKIDKTTWEQEVTIDDVEVVAAFMNYD